MCSTPGCNLFWVFFGIFHVDILPRGRASSGIRHPRGWISGFTPGPCRRKAARWLPEHLDRHTILLGGFEDELRIGGAALDFLAEVGTSSWKWSERVLSPILTSARFCGASRPSSTVTRFGGTVQIFHQCGAAGRRPLAMASPITWGQILARDATVAAVEQQQVGQHSGKPSVSILGWMDGGKHDVEHGDAQQRMQQRLAFLLREPLEQFLHERRRFRFRWRPSGRVRRARRGRAPRPPPAHRRRAAGGCCSAAGWAPRPG